jgi:type III secretion protein L
VKKSNKKFFSLIYGDKVHVAPETKVVSGEEFSALMNAEEILQKVKQDALKYREEVTAECEKIKEQAAKEGFEEGFSKWAEQLALLEKHIAEVGKTYENVLVPVATKAAKKIVGQELEMREDTIVDIVSNILKAVAQHKKITIYVNRKHLQTLEQNRPKLKNLFEELQSLSIRERNDIDEGGCVVETEGGIINAQLANQWQLLEQAFDTILKGPKQASH